MTAVAESTEAHRTSLGAALRVVHEPAPVDLAAAEHFAPRPFELTMFLNDEGYDDLVLARSIPVRSVGEHHLLPFVGASTGCRPTWRRAASASR